MWSRPVRSMVLAALLVSCGDGPTEPEPVRNVPGSIAFATSTSEDGLSITTDKDDYQPGDTVHFTGTGWQAGDLLDIVLVDEPQTHDPHLWSVNVGEDGTFHDSTYVVDTGDLGVTFTLTATSRATGRSLVVQFTDAALNSNIAFTINAGLGPHTVNAGDPLNWSFTATCLNGSGVNTCVSGGLTLNGPVSNGYLADIEQSTTAGFSPAPTVTVRAAAQATAGGTGTASASFAAPTTAGTYFYRARHANQVGLLQGLISNNWGGQNSNVVQVTVAAAPTKLDFTTPARTAAVGQCTAVLTVQSQLADGTPANVASNTSLTLTSSSAGGSFHTNAACTTSGAVSIASGTNSASFFYKDTNAGTPLITAAASGLTSATQTQNITEGNALVTVTASPVSPTVFGQSVSFTAAVTAVAPAVGTPTGSVTFHDGAACSDPQIGLSKTLAGGSATSDATTTLSVGSHTITACYGGGSGFNAQMGQMAHTVNQAATSLTLEITPNTGSTYFGQNVTLEATIAVTAPGSGTPTGNVEFFKVASAASACGDAGNVLLGSDAIDSGTLEASFSTTVLAVGTYIIKACYAEAEDPNYAASASNAVNHEVKKAVTETLLADSPASTEFGQTVTFTATVTVKTGFGAGTPAGSVTFKTGVTSGDCTTGTALTGVAPSATNPATLNGSGVATFTVNSLPVGSTTVTACYGGNASFEPSHDDEEHVVTAATTATVVSVTPPSQQYSDKVNLGAVVTPHQILTEELTGDVHFFVGAVAVSCSPLPAGEVGMDAITAADDGVAQFLYPIDKASGSYVVTGCFVSSKAEFASSDDTDGLTVTKEDATLAYDATNPLALQVTTPGGTSGSFTIKASVHETYPELNAELSLVMPGDITYAGISITLVPIAAGSSITGTGCSYALSGTTPSYTATRMVTCNFSGVPVNTYAVQVNVTGDYYTATGLEEVITVFDPSLGFVTGGGTFEWPGTYERVNFGFTIKYNKKGTNPQGSLLVIRHTSTGEIYRAKSNALSGGPAISGSTATFSGKSTYIEPGWATATGNNGFTVYIDDLAESGAGSDQFWLQLKDGLGAVIANLSLPTTAAANARTLTGGNIQVPHVTGP